MGGGEIAGSGVENLGDSLHRKLLKIPHIGTLVYGRDGETETDNSNVVAQPTGSKVVDR